jgi:hypothetical protein
LNFEVFLFVIDVQFDPDLYFHLECFALDEGALWSCTESGDKEIYFTARAGAKGKYRKQQTVRGYAEEIGCWCGPLW